MNSSVETRGTKRTSIRLSHRQNMEEFVISDSDDDEQFIHSMTAYKSRISNVTFNGRRQWTDDEVETLRYLKQHSQSDTEIAAALGRNESSVRMKWKRLQKTGDNELSKRGEWIRGSSNSMEQLQQSQNEEWMACLRWLDDAGLGEHRDQLAWQWKEDEVDFPTLKRLDHDDLVCVFNVLRAIRTILAALR